MRRLSAIVAFLILSLVSGRSDLIGQQDRAPGTDAKPPEGLALETAETLEFTTDEATWPVR